MVKEVRILLVGESNVGKTNLILSLVSEEFSARVPKRAEEITIPADVTPEKVPTQIVDYCEEEQNEYELIQEILRASVICIVYSVVDQQSMNKIVEFWLPFIRSHCDSQNRKERTPIILVGNKLDLLPQGNIKKILPIMNQFSEVETCIECSAMTLGNLSEMFWYAQKAVLYPTAPLYNGQKRELSENCVRALNRIFRICDLDNDGYLSDKELEAFQRRCFQMPLKSGMLEEVKSLIRRQLPDGSGLSQNGLTCKGFLQLHLAFIHKGRHETTWTVLRHFGYSSNLQLSREYLTVSPGTLQIPRDSTTEPSVPVKKFLINLFNRFDVDRDECLSMGEMEALLSTCAMDRQGGDAALGWGSYFDVAGSVRTNEKGWPTRDGFIAYWTLMAYLDPHLFLEYVAYLGYTYDLSGMSSSSTSAESHFTRRNSYNANHQHHASSQNSSSTSSSALDLGSSAQTPNHTAQSNNNSSGGGGSHHSHQQAYQSATSNSSLASPSQGTPPHSQQHESALRTALVVTRAKRIDLHKRATERLVFHCKVYGSSKCGKTCFLQGFLGRSLQWLAAATSHHFVIPSQVVATVKPQLGGPADSERTLILQEVEAGRGEQQNQDEALENADVVCLLWDSTDPESFKYAADIYLTFYQGTRIPVLFVATKAEQNEVSQIYHLDAHEFTSKHRLEPPMRFSAMHGATSGARGGSGAGGGAGAGGRLEFELGADCYAKLALMANYPHLKGLQVSSQNDFAWRATLAATVLAGMGFVVFKMAKTHI